MFSVSWLPGYLYLCDMIQFRQTDIFFYYFYQNRSEHGRPIVMKTLQEVLVLSQVL